MGLTIFPQLELGVCLVCHRSLSIAFLVDCADSIGGQAIGMRSMAIYELNADYVKYSRFLGIKDRKIVGYVFRNAMLPQITGLALIDRHHGWRRTGG